MSSCHVHLVYGHFYFSWFYRLRFIFYFFIFSFLIYMKILEMLSITITMFTPVCLPSGLCCSVNGALRSHKRRLLPESCESVDWRFSLTTKMLILTNCTVILPLLNVQIVLDLTCTAAAVVTLTHCNTWLCSYFLPKARINDNCVFPACLTEDVVFPFNVRHFFSETR